MLDDFYLYSGLRLNMDKSTIFLAGLWKRFIYIIFSDEFFPVKYLCVPLITTRLDSRDCKLLIDNRTHRVQSWSNRLLSYGGRTQLVTSVLFSTQIY